MRPLDKSVPCSLCVAERTLTGCGYVGYDANGLLVYGATGYQFDPQGNTTHLLNNSGSAVGHLAYDAWGQRMSDSNPTPYGYKGQWGYYTDAETELLLLTHCHFDPATGSFLTRDPIGVKEGTPASCVTANVMRAERVLPAARFAGCSERERVRQGVALDAKVDLHRVIGNWAC